MLQWDGGTLYSSDKSARSKLALEQFLQETCSRQATKCLMTEKLSLTLLHTDLLVKARCPLFHGTCVFNNTLIFE